MGRGHRSSGELSHRVLDVLLADPSAELAGLEVCARSGLRPGTIHPVLARFEARRWLESRWEDLDPLTADRLPRRLYRLTAEGARCAQAALEVARSPLSRLRAAQDTP
jgi:PadR family transcriptional regulator, regulatory protein PadR